jgi:hypothetical protein
MPLFAGTLGAVFNETHQPVTSRASAQFGVHDLQGLAGLPSSIASSSIVSSNSSIAVIRLTDPAITAIYADLFLYVQAACYLILLQAARVLAVSMAVVANVETLWLCVHSWYLNMMTHTMASLSQEDFGPMVMALKLIPSPGQVWRQMLPSFKQWRASMDVQQGDVQYVVASHLLFWTNAIIINTPTSYVPRWIACCCVSSVLYVYIPHVSRPAQRARFDVAVWLATKLLCAYTDLPLPASPPKTMMLLGILSFLAPNATDDNLEDLFVCCCGNVLPLVSYVSAWVMVTWIVANYGFLYVRKTATLLCIVVSRVFGFPLKASSSLLTFLGAIEMTAAAAAAQWLKAQQAKLHLKYKYMRRIWRRTNGNFGTFMWQLLHGIMAGPGGGSSNAAGRRSKSGSKRGGKAAAPARSGSRPSRYSRASV